jgi:hypothetical protein
VIRPQRRPRDLMSGSNPLQAPSAGTVPSHVPRQT